MTNDDKIKDEKLQYNINKEAAIISALPSGKIDKYEYLTSNEILPSDKKKGDRTSYVYIFFFTKSFRKPKKNN